jgi:predicted nucleic acid-binding Zn ribbon protein
MDTFSPRCPTCGKAIPGDDVLETKEGKLIRLGSMLTNDRRRFLAAILRKYLVR